MRSESCLLGVWGKGVSGGMNFGGGGRPVRLFAPSAESGPEGQRPGFIEPVEDDDWAVVESGIVSPDEALGLLIAGNDRFANEQSIRRPMSRSERSDLAQEQHPFVAVLGCSDSRVPVEVIFDRLPGDVFTVRVAGNVASPLTVASLEFAVLKLGVPLIVVLGHQQCGAVTAAARGETGRTLPGMLPEILVRIRPALNLCDTSLPFPQLVNELKIANVKFQMSELEKSPVLSSAVAEGRLKIVGAYFTISDGRVTLIGGGAGA